MWVDGVVNLFVVAMVFPFQINEVHLYNVIELLGDFAVVFVPFFEPVIEFVIGIVLVFLFCLMHV